MSIHPYAFNRELVDERLRRRLADTHRLQRERLSRPPRTASPLRLPAAIERRLVAVGEVFRIGPEPKPPTV